MLKVQQATKSTDDDFAISPPPLPEYADRPIDFFREILGVEPWTATVPGQTGQIDILRALPRHRSIAVRSGHKVGKSNIAAGIALWWFCTRPTARAILTAPTARQVRIVLWREVRRLYRIARRRARVKSRELGPDPSKDPSSGILADDGREILGFSTDDPDRFSGISGPNVLYIVDEASGVDEPIFEAIEGNRAGGAYLLLFSNPTQTSGKFYDAFHRERHVFHCLHISSEHTPANDNAIPGLATRDWVDERRRVWGEDSAIYAVRVRGDFPEQSSDAAIPLRLLEHALRAWPATTYDGPLRIGVDVAEFGDDSTVIQPVRGHKTYTPTVLRSMDAVDIAGAVLELVRDMRAEGEVPVVNVDSIGVGSGVHALLARSGDVTAIDVNVSRTADDDTKFHNLRAQLHFSLRDWLAEGGALHPDAELEGELVAPRYRFDNRNRYQIESKDEIKLRLRRSPDRMDALMLAVYQAPRTVVHLMPRREGSRWGGMAGRGF